MSTDREQRRGTEEWNRIDRGDLDREPDRDAPDKTDDTCEATREGAGSEPPD
jgi:hypothetical protein